jgi:acyl-CoA thioesterase
MIEKKYEGLKEYFQDTYRDNSYVKLLEMRLVQVEPGTASISMPVNPERHTNLYHVAHGGAMASLADTVMGVACGSVGRRVVTLELNMNFIKAADANTIITGVGRIIHNGRNTLVAEGEILSADGTLLLKARGTFYVVGQFDLESAN